MPPLQIILRYDLLVTATRDGVAGGEAGSPLSLEAAIDNCEIEI
jgi:hypothetical protein